MSTFGDILGGAGSGALAGSAVPGFGTVVGGLIGGIGGLFGSKKKKKAKKAAKKAAKAAKAAAMSRYSNMLLGKEARDKAVAKARIGEESNLIAERQIGGKGPGAYAGGPSVYNQAMEDFDWNKAQSDKMFQNEVNAFNQQLKAGQYADAANKAAQQQSELESYFGIPLAVLGSGLFSSKPQTPYQAALGAGKSAYSSIPNLW